MNEDAEEEGSGDYHAAHTEFLRAYGSAMLQWQLVEEGACISFIRQ
jgi:hypothetical protein